MNAKDRSINSINSDSSPMDNVDGTENKQKITNSLTRHRVRIYFSTESTLLVTTRNFVNCVTTDNILERL